jgi:hypothetical protein
VKIIDTAKAQISKLLSGTRRILNSEMLREILRESLNGG